MLEGAAAAGGWEDAVAVGPMPQRARFLRDGVPPQEGTPQDGARERVGAVPGDEVHARTRGGPLRARVGAHPVPDASSVEAAERLQAFLMRVPAEALVIALVSGGASAMVAKPRTGVTLEEKVAATSRRMAEGAAIAELNALRRSLSAVKGGQLIEDVAAPVVSLLLSDVAGDDPRVVASGLTISKQASPLEGRGWAQRASGHRTGWTGLPAIRAADRYVILAGQDAVARAAADALGSRGWAVTLRKEGLVDPVEDAARELVAALDGAEAHSASGRKAIVAYGEPVVALPRGAGAGGRAQQLALLLARDVAESPVVVLVAGTDGVDGPSLPPVAGAIVDGETWAAVRDAGVDGSSALARCDARTALEAVGQLLVTGPTGVNHADVMILLWDPAGAAGAAGAGREQGWPGTLTQA
jgi:glycerate 2-kinase